MPSTSSSPSLQAAAAKSYAGQETSFFIPRTQGIFVQDMGFQPLGITLRDGVIAIANYADIAALLAVVAVEEEFVHLKIGWIRGTAYGEERVRMFPDILKSRGVNRMQAVVVFSANKLGLLRSADNKIFVVERGADGAWHHVEIITLDRNPMIHSIIWTGSDFAAVVSNVSLENWEIARWSSSGSFISAGASLPHDRYGLAERGGSFITIADFRAEEAGIFCGDRIIASDIRGNGIVLLNDGEDGAIVTRYGQSHPGPFNGIPGALVYVPRSELHF